MQDQTSEGRGANAGVPDRRRREGRESTAATSAAPAERLETQGTRRGSGLTRANHVLAAIESGSSSAVTLDHAVVVARASGARLTLARVLDPPTDAARDVPVDAFEWELARSEAEDRLDIESRRLRLQGLSVSTELLVGRPVEQLLALLNRDPAELIVVSGDEQLGDLEPGLSSTADRLIERAGTSVLVVPADAGQLPDSAVPPLASILVPLDGSGRAEAALPLAVELAREYDSELVLAHAAPGVELTPTGGHSAEDEELVERVRARNLRIGQEYIERLCGRLRSDGVVARGVVESCQDTPRALGEIIAREAPDLIVASADGCTAARPVGYGSVARYLVRHARAPMIIVRARGSASLGDRSAPSDPARPHFHEETQV